MLTVVAILLALTVLPAPWGLGAVVGAAAVDVAETVLFVRWSKRRAAAVGAETLVGRRAVVVHVGSAGGHVKLDGELWEARSGATLVPGEQVVIRRVEGLVLDVERDGSTTP